MVDNRSDKEKSDAANRRIIEMADKLVVEQELQNLEMGVKNDNIVEQICEKDLNDKTRAELDRIIFGLNGTKVVRPKCNVICLDSARRIKRNI